MPRKHGPRYAIKGKKKAWVTRNKDGTFKKWTNKARSLRVDRLWKAPQGTRPGQGARKDYRRKE